MGAAGALRPLAILWVGSLWVCAPLRADSTYWSHPPEAAGDWHVQANWSAGVPGADDIAYVSNGGTAHLASGQAAALHLVAGYLSPGAVHQTGGSLAVAENVYLGYSGGDGTYTLSAGQLSGEIFFVGEFGAAGMLDLAGPAAEVVVSVRLGLGRYSILSAGDGSGVRMVGAAFDNQQTRPEQLAGLARLTVVFEGGPGQVDTFETAGEDMGPAVEGWQGNFALGSLTLGAAACGRIRLLDNHDNRPAWQGAEALYVHTLVLNAGAVIEPGECNLYYLNGAAPKRFFVGDADLDGAVALSDLSAVAFHWGSASGATWAMGDFDGDGMIALADLSALAFNWGAATAAVGAAPEPVALLLIAVGGPWRLRRKPRRMISRTRA